MSMLDGILPSIDPDTLLDVGCGCGHFTRSLDIHCAGIVAVDPDLSFIPEWRDIRDSSTVCFSCMDGTRLAFADNSFSAVLQRDALHHTADWMHVIDEMMRVSSAHVLIEEPIDDLRSDGKRNAFKAQNLFLELQQEVEYPHFRHLQPEDLTSYIQTKGTVVETRTRRVDVTVPFDEFFDSFDRFAARSARESYWLDRLEAFRLSLGTGVLCDDDRFLLVATKRRVGA
jgi:SAM-dependent methyltransferase